MPSILTLAINKEIAKVETSFLVLDTFKNNISFFNN